MERVSSPCDRLQPQLTILPPSLYLICVLVDWCLHRGCASASRGSWAVPLGYDGKMAHGSWSCLSLDGEMFDENTVKSVPTYCGMP